MIKRYPIQPYHLLSYSPWPLGASIAGLIVTIGAVLKMNSYGSIVIILGIIVLIMTIVLWFRDIIIEGSLMGYHTTYVRISITIGFILFIISEVMLFFSLFWAYFHSSLSPSIEIGSVWPPIGITAINKYELPLTNTIILITSGATVTVSHNIIIDKSREAYRKGVRYLIITVILGTVFVILQGIEYKYSLYNITDSIYGTVFYATTSLHGIHVIIGLIYIIVGLIRVINYSITREHHKGLEFAIYYWHRSRYNLVIIVYNILLSKSDGIE